MSLDTCHSAGTILFFLQITPLGFFQMRAQELKSSMYIEIIILYGTVRLLAGDQLCDKNSQ